MKIYIGTDHAGFELKEKLKKWLGNSGHEVIDKGAFEYNEEDDYTDFVIPAAESVAGDNNSVGIILGGSGQGEAMAANGIPGIRAIVYYGGTLDIVKLGREHNDANVLSLGARFLLFWKTKRAVKMFLNTKFSGKGKYERRIEKEDKYDRKN